jgi:3-methyladenine DNA glycosylase AlkD
MVLSDVAALGKGRKTADIDRLIRRYVREKADPSALRPHILDRQVLHRIYYYVALYQINDPKDRAEFIDRNLLFSDWWHTDQVISFVADLDLDTALRYAGEYIHAEDPFVRRWGYVLFISRLGRGHAAKILPLMKNDDHYSVQMAQGWLIAELAVFEPEMVHAWMGQNGLNYSINGKAIQKICDSFRISQQWKESFKSLRPKLRLQK